MYRKEANQISVASGTVVLAESGQLYQAVRIIPHPKYDTKTRVNDIALIRVSRDIVFTNKIQKIDLPKSDLKPVDYAAILTGWGVTSVCTQKIGTDFKNFNLIFFF